jgi:hypothetical protein
MRRHRLPATTLLSCLAGVSVAVGGLVAGGGRSRPVPPAAWPVTNPLALEAAGSDDREVLVNQPASSTGTCGVDRWSVKTGTDPDAGLVDTSAATLTTIAYLDGLAVPYTPSNGRAQPTETTMFQLQATLVQYALEADSDYHLVLRDDSGNTMITEIPDPACVDASSPFAAMVKRARAQFDAQYTPAGGFRQANVPVTITGVGFFDTAHGQTGVAPNAVELHPVLDIRFGATSCVASAAQGYWLTASDGGIFPFGRACGYGSTGGIHLNQPIVGMASTPTERGYWLVAADGGIFPFGDARGYGSTGGAHLNSPIVAMARTATGRGYWLVASDGGIFPFGDAGGFGSTGGMHLNAPIVGMASTATGRGYWLVANDGGIFPFGDAGGYGSTGGTHLNSPIVAMARTASGKGYWLVAADGGIFPFGDARSHSYGSTGGTHLNRPIVGMASTASGNGYWLVASDGGIFPFGDAGGYGSTGGVRLNQAIVAIASSG